MHPYDLSIFHPPFDVQGGTLSEFTFGRYVAFLHLLEDPVLPDLPVDGVAAREPGEDELRVFAWLCLNGPADIARVMAYNPGLAVAAATDGLNESDMRQVRRAWNVAKAAIDACAFDSVPRSSGPDVDCPLEEEERHWPAGNAGVVHAVVRGTGWPREYVLWELPLAAALSHAHCEMQLSGVYCARRGYKAGKRAKALGLVTGAMDSEDDALGFAGLEEEES